MVLQQRSLRACYCHLCLHTVSLYYILCTFLPVAELAFEWQCFIREAIVKGTSRLCYVCLTPHIPPVTVTVSLEQVPSMSVCGRAFPISFLYTRS